jgi:plastocyanin
MKKLAALCVLALFAVALVACGDDNDDNGTTATTATTNGSEAAGGAAAGGKANAAEGGESTLMIEADPNGDLAYTTTEATVNAGKVKVEFDNPQSLSHDVSFEDSSDEDVGATELISDSTTSTTLDFEPGTYTFYCTVPGHREAGMEGTLTVK